MKYNKLYLLHIPKTAGWYLRTELLDFVADGLKEKNIELIDFENNSHSGWSLVDDETYLITCFRDPVKRLVSHFAYMIGLYEYYSNSLTNQPDFIQELSDKQQETIRQNTCFIIKNSEQIHGYKTTVKDLFKWIENNKEYLRNFQAKNIMLDYDREDYRFFWKDFYFDLIGKALKKEQVYFRLGRIEILLKDTQLTYNNMDILKEKIKKDLDFLAPVNRPAGIWAEMEAISPWNSGHNIFDGSKQLYNQLTEEQKQYIYDFNDIDTDIYNNYSLFWNSGIETLKS